MASLSMRSQRKLKLFNQIIEAEEEKTIRDYQIQIAAMREAGASKEAIRKHLASGGALLTWERMINRVRMAVANSVNAISDIGYYEGLRRGGIKR